MAVSPDYIDLPAATGNGVNTNFDTGVDIPGTPWVLVVVGGVVQSSSAYSTTGSTVIFSEAPPAGVDIRFRLAKLNPSGASAGVYSPVTSLTVDTYGRVTAVSA